MYQRPLSNPINKTIPNLVYRGQTALQLSGISTVRCYPYKFQTVEGAEIPFRSKMFWTVEPVDQKYIQKGKRNFVIPEYAFLEAIEDIKYCGDEQTILETLDVYKHWYLDSDFIKRVKELNEVEKIASKEQLDKYEEIWEKT